VVLVIACASSLESRRQRATGIAAAGSLAPVHFETRAFSLAGYRRAAGPGGEAELHVYLEGDGLAWLTRRRPSADPTPEDPVGLELASRDPGPAAVLYLARPCQYGDASESSCDVSVWTDARFSEQVVASVDEAISQEVHARGVRRLVLFGYSGGGVVAALVAARRNDVARLVTVGSPLDHSVWTREVGATPLRGSLRPVDYAPALRAIPQVHFVGARDTRVPRSAVDAYVVALGAPPGVRVESVADFDHHCCWEAAWPELLARAGVITRMATPARP
jgi:dienelactone hydrolase